MIKNNYTLVIIVLSHSTAQRLSICSVRLMNRRRHNRISIKCRHENFIFRYIQNNLMSIECTLSMFIYYKLKTFCKQNYGYSSVLVS